MKNKTTRQHYEKYDAMMKAVGLTLIGARTEEFEPEHVAKCYAKDVHLNNIDLEVFDRYYFWMREKKGGPKSMADNVCMYKHALIYEVLGCEPEFTDEEV